MLSKTKMVKALESLYTGTCTVIEYKKVKKPNKSIGFEEVVVLENQPCRVSYKTINSTSATDNAVSVVTQVTKLFISNDVYISTGSKIISVQNGVTTEYKSSGEPAHYETHQEIILELFKGWS